MGSKTNKKDKKNCTDHTFVLKAKNAFCHYSQTLNIDFCKQSMSSGRGKKVEAKCFQGPVFNKDRNFNTPTFVIASEQKNYEPKDFKNGLENNNRYTGIDYEKSLLFIPKPNSKSMYCSVCKQKYEEYIQHIATNKHKSNIRSNKFTFYIQEHAEHFKEKNPIQPASTNTQSNIIVISDDEDENIEERSKPSKRVKKHSQYVQKKTIANQQQRLNQMEIQRSIAPIQNNSMFYNPMMSSYGLNYNFGMTLPNLMPFNQSFPSMLPNMSQMPFFGCLGHQQMINQIHYGCMPRRSNYAYLHDS